MKRDVLSATAFSDSAELRQHMLDELRRTMGWELTFFTRVTGGELEILETSGPADWLAPRTIVPLEATLCFRMLNGTAPAVTDRASDPDDPFHDAPACLALGIESYSGHVVRRRNGSAFGTICAIDRSRRLPTETQRQLGETFARLLAWEVERESMVEELATRASTDDLTGLANRHVLFAQLRMETERATRRGRDLSLVMLDLDHFKRVNDAHGHPMGDVVLQEVAVRLQAEARPGDLVARVGGEEFAWLMPETDGLEAWQGAERARQAIAGLPFAHGKLLTVCAGVAELAQAGAADELYRVADRALYWAKEQGRDLCFRYSPDLIGALSSGERTHAARSRAEVALRALARAVDARDPSTQRHSERVADFAAQCALELDWSAERAALLRDAGLVHDVGKTGVPDAILFKPARLTPREFARVAEHAALGARIVTDVLAPEQVGWVRHHHERFDGRGYPDALSAEAIPAGARILALADAWDAMTSPRVYAPAIGQDDALRECRGQSGRQFCPSVVAALERMLTRVALPQSPSDAPEAVPSLDPAGRA